MKNIYLIGSPEEQYTFIRELKKKSEIIIIQGQMISVTSFKKQNTLNVITAEDFSDNDIIIFLLDNAKDIVKVLNYIPESIPIEFYSRTVDGAPLTYLKKTIINLNNKILFEPKFQRTQSTSLFNCFASFFASTDEADEMRTPVLSITSFRN